MKNVYISLALLLIFVLASCVTGHFSSGIDFKRDEHGNVLLLDTPKNWDTWVTIIDAEIAHETAGLKPPGGAKTWDERWLRSIEHLGKGHRENYIKYINYIIVKRQHAGLPAIREMGPN